MKMLMTKVRFCSKLCMDELNLFLQTQNPNQLGKNQGKDSFMQCYYNAAAISRCYATSNITTEAFVTTDNFLRCIYILFNSFDFIPLILFV